MLWGLGCLYLGNTFLILRRVLHWTIKVYTLCKQASVTQKFREYDGKLRWSTDGKGIVE